jgi:iron complex transport system ATP-binding protein
VSTDALSPGLATENLACGYVRARRTVLTDLNLRIARGRFVCIIGPNGAGKTTLLRTLAGLLPPIAGHVRLGGSRLEALHARERARRLSVVLTNLAAPGYLSVERFVELGRHPYTGLLARLTDADRDAIDQALAQTGIDELRTRWMSEISDGERQRAAVARALAQAADVMILDEPTAFLDVAARASVMTTLRRIAHSTGRLIATTSHDVELVLRTADILVVIDDARTITTGSPEDLVLSGAIASLFPDRSLRFDSESGTFRLPHPAGTPVRLVGTGLVAVWTAHAIERIGRPVVSKALKTTADGSPCGTASAYTPTVICPDDPGGTWDVRLQSGRRTAASIEALAEVLRE